MLQPKHNSVQFDTNGKLACPEISSTKPQGRHTLRQATALCRETSTRYGRLRNLFFQPQTANNWKSTSPTLPANLLANSRNRLQRTYVTSTHNKLYGFSPPPCLPFVLLRLLSSGDETDQQCLYRISSMCGMTICEISGVLF